MAKKEFLEVPADENEKKSSAFSFLLSVDQREMVTDVRIVFSFRRDNVASDSLTLTTSIRSNREIIKKRVESTATEFIEKRFPGNHQLRGEAKTFIDRVQTKLNEFLNGANHNTKLAV